MKGLILKDFINLKKNMKIFGGLTILYGAMAIFSGDTDFFSTVLIVLVSILTLSIYSYDDLAKWDTFALTTPVSRDKIVQSRYIMMLLLTLIGAAYSAVFTVVINVYLKSVSMFHGFASIGAGVSVVILFYSITIPVITKLGVEKARLIFFAVYMIPFIIIYGLSKLTSSGGLVIPESVIRLAQIFIENIYIIAPLFVISALAVSYLISVGIYSKKEF